MDRERAMKGLEIILNGCDEIQCEDCSFNIKEPAKPRRCGILDEEQIHQDALDLLKEQEEQIKNRDESLEKAREEIKWLRGMLKKQEAEIRQLRLALDIAKGTCKGIKSGGGQFADMPTMQSAT